MISRLLYVHHDFMVFQLLTYTKAPWCHRTVVRVYLKCENCKELKLQIPTPHVVFESLKFNPHLTENGLFTFSA